MQTIFTPYLDYNQFISQPLLTLTTCSLISPILNLLCLMWLEQKRLTLIYTQDIIHQLTYFDHQAALL